MSLRAAPLPGVAPGLSGLQAPADPVSSVAWGLRLVVPLVPDTLHRLRLLQFSPLLLLRRVVPFALKDSSVATLGAIRDLARDTAEVPLQVGACLQQHWQEWENIGAYEWVVKTLRFGQSVSIFAGLGIVGWPALGCWSRFKIPDELSTLIPCLSEFIR
ncbi:hypothetical protein E2C01_054653 [Portunus trituberculatus]|uniref:Uncharacterized protein n=1 Tax=Portunus trituberculatus TaxID=210409 RepID=A0A5B7GK76_PORTR|nr:hypothetical protein [Portunus trituberculatus]